MNKQQQRETAYAARHAQIDKGLNSAKICSHLIQQAWYQAAQTVLWYVHCRSEVRTLPVIQQQLQTGKKLVVPYCTVNQYGEKCLGLWRLEAIEELCPGMWNIPEPPNQRRQEPEKQVLIEELDVIIVPGVAFDTQGGRLGNGAGYYDRLMEKVRPDAVLAGVCYQSQIMPEIIMQIHDVYMDYVVTEQAIYTGKRYFLT